MKAIDTDRNSNYIEKDLNVQIHILKDTVIGTNSRSWAHCLNMTDELFSAIDEKRLETCMIIILTKNDIFVINRRLSHPKNSEVPSMHR